MITRHAKSPCCGSKVRRFGRRRRQCVSCQKTWSIRPQKRGRPKLRTGLNILKRTLVDRYTIRQLAEQRGMLSAPTLRHRFRDLLVRFVRKPRSYKIPSGPLVLLADGMRFQFSGKPWVLYLMAIKSCAGAKALFLDPLLIQGKEGAMRWEQAFATVPKDFCSRISGLVVDNLNGMRKIARWQHWVLQLCQFHLIHKLQFHRRGRYRALKGGKVREELYWLVRKALELPVGIELNSVVNSLRKRAKGDCGTRRMQAVIREFLACLEHYRAYRTHPSLGMPATTNVMESMGGIIRDMFRRSHAANNPAALLLWATAFIRLHPQLVCNGRNSTD